MSNQQNSSGRDVASATLTHWLLIIILLAVGWLLWQSGAFEALAGGGRTVVVTMQPEQPATSRPEVQQVPVYQTVETVIVVTATPAWHGGGVGVRACDVPPGYRKAAGCP